MQMKMQLKGRQMQMQPWQMKGRQRQMQVRQMQQVLELLLQLLCGVGLLELEFWCIGLLQLQLLVGCAMDVPSAAMGDMAVLNAEHGLGLAAWGIVSVGQMEEKYLGQRDDEHAVTFVDGTFEHCMQSRCGHPL